MNEILKEQIQKSCDIKTSKERFDKVNHLLPTEVILGVRDDNTVVVYDVEYSHNIICGNTGSGRKALPTIILAQLLTHRLPVYCCDSTYELPLLLQNYDNLIVVEDSEVLVDEIKELCRRRVKKLMKSDCINTFEYNMNHPLESMANIVAYLRGVSGYEDLLEMSAMVGIKLIVDGDFNPNCRNLEFIDDMKLRYSGEEVNIHQSDLQYVLSVCKERLGEKCHYLSKDEKISIYTGVPEI